MATTNTTHGGLPALSRGVAAGALHPNDDERLGGHVDFGSDMVKRERVYSRDRPMIRRSPRPESGFTILRNETVRDGRLSYKARGLLLYLLSLPDDWTVSSEHLARMSERDGRDAVRTGLDELERAGYLKRWRHQDDRGRWVNESVIYDQPCV